MLIMPGNHSSWFVHYWSGKCPGVFAHLWSPPRAIDLYPHLDYACDNYRFAATVGGKFWSAREFRRWIAQIRALPKKPLFLVVPDVPFHAKETLEEWQVWEPELRELGVPLAFAVQNGIKLEQIPKSTDWLFVGGTDEWRYPRLREITGMGKPVHVGRVNSMRRIWQCDEAGVVSVDGTGWFRGDEYRKLESYLQYRIGALKCPQVCVGGCGGIGVSGGCSVSQGQLGIDAPSLLGPHSALIKQSPPWQRQSIPGNLQRHHLLLAIREWKTWTKDWEANGRRLKNQRFWVVYEGSLYPPKLLISVANVYANGRMLPTHAFSGGRDAHRFLRQRGFEVVEAAR